MNDLTDYLGRKFEVLRISVLNSCNFACSYCVCEDDKNVTPQDTGSLSLQELIQTIKKIHQILGLKTVRLTGGEPLLYKELPQLITAITKIGVTDIRLTTNGFLLKHKIEILKAAGLSSINVSLDAVNDDAFFRMTRRNEVSKVIDGIITASRLGIQVKINSVIMAGINDKEILPLLKFAFEHDLKIRFLELMNMGFLHQSSVNYLYSQAQILRQIQSVYAIRKKIRPSSSTANYWETSCGHTFGIIANESHPFCADCNRLRLDSSGNIYGCLSNNNPISIHPGDQIPEIKQKLKQALSQKQLRFSGTRLSMKSIGG